MAAPQTSEGLADRNTSTMVGEPSEGSPTVSKAFEEFFRSEYRSVTKYLMVMGASMQDAEDAVASAMSAAYRQWDNIQRPRAWVRIVASRTFMKNAGRRHDETERAVSSGLWRPPDPHSDLAEVEQRDYVLGLLGNLPPAQREVLAFAMDGYSPTEIATMLGKTANTVRSNLMHARRQLQQQHLGQERRVRLSYEVRRQSLRGDKGSVEIRADRDCRDLELLVVGAHGERKPDRVADGELLQRFTGLSLIAGEATSFPVELPHRDSRGPYLLRCFVEPRERFAVVDPPIQKLLAA